MKGNRRNAGPARPRGQRCSDWSPAMPDPTSIPAVEVPARPAELLCDRHPAGRTAFTIIEADLSTSDLSYGRLKERSELAAAALARLGVKPGDRVATLMGKSAELATVLLGIWR